MPPCWRATSSPAGSRTTAKTSQAGPGGGDGDRLVILSPRRDLSAVALLRALAAAGIDVEDELGEVPEPSLAVQIQRAILAYHQDNAGIDGLMAVVELLNEHVAVWDGQGANILRAVFPLDPVEVRRLLHAAFGDVQHHSVRVLSDVFARARSEAARPLRALVEHLGEWPDDARLAGRARALAGMPRRAGPEHRPPGAALVPTRKAAAARPGARAGFLPVSGGHPRIARRPGVPRTAATATRAWS